MTTEHQPDNEDFDYEKYIRDNTPSWEASAKEGEQAFRACLHDGEDSTNCFRTGLSAFVTALANRHYVMFDAQDSQEGAIVAAHKECIDKDLADRRALIDHVSWSAQTVHQAYHRDSDVVWNDCPRSVCAASARVLGGLQ